VLYISSMYIKRMFVAITNQTGTEETISDFFSIVLMETFYFLHGYVFESSQSKFFFLTLEKDGVCDSGKRMISNSDPFLVT
jgi:hypothetical protein